MVTGDTSVREVDGHADAVFTRGIMSVRERFPCLFSFSFPDRRARLIAEASEP